MAYREFSDRGVRVMPLGFQVIDGHQHFYDASTLSYGLFKAPSEGFAAMVGDYAALPRRYGPEDYARDARGLDVVGSVWAEFISDDPVAEVEWAGALLRNRRQRSSLIGLVDFADPGLERLIETYQAAGGVRCVRQHMGWHPTETSLRFTPRADRLEDTDWQRGLAVVASKGMVCEVEVFSSQLASFARVATAHPALRLVLPIMGWPVDVSEEGRVLWRRDLRRVAECPNVSIKIFGLECIFGVHWTIPQVRPWILDAIDAFSPQRSMFASHMPICKLACSMGQLYAAYDEITSSFSEADRRSMFHAVAKDTYFADSREGRTEDRSNWA